MMLATGFAAGADGAGAVFVFVVEITPPVDTGLPVETGPPVDTGPPVETGVYTLPNGLPYALVYTPLLPLSTVNGVLKPTPGLLVPP